MRLACFCDFLIVFGTAKRKGFNKDTSCLNNYIQIPIGVFLYNDIILSNNNHHNELKFVNNQHMKSIYYGQKRT
jgi:hypothetical protein